MPPEPLAAYLRERLEDRIADHTTAYGQLTVTVAPEALPSAVQLCRDDTRLAFDFFDFMSGVDEREDGFAVVTHLYSTRHRHHITIRALAPGGRDEPHLPTITHLYHGANWYEREVYDMFGVVFDGHPGLLPRILTVENFEGFPLRKEFLLMTREVKPWPGLKEPKDAEEEEGDGEAPSTGPSAEEKARMAREKAERAKAKAAEARKRRALEQAEQADEEGES
jgi:NADH-quinone oxidoreductase subunit C